MKQSKYATKRASGKMEFGPAPKVPKYPDFHPGRVIVFCTCHNPPRIYRECQKEKDLAALQAAKAAQRGY